MSHRLYSHRVFWDGRHGCVVVHGVYRNLTTAPVFRGIEEIDYAPESGCMQLRPEFGKMRDMRPAEIEMTEAYMRAVQFGAPHVLLKDLPSDGSEVP